MKICYESVGYWENVLLVPNNFMLALRMLTSSFYQPNVGNFSEKRERKWEREMEGASSPLRKLHVRRLVVSGIEAVAVEID